MRIVDEQAALHGFYLPAPWEPHARTWMAWPCRTELWGAGLLSAQTAFAEVARAIATFEPVTMAARPEQADEARLACGRTIEIWPVSLDDSWARDIAPTFVVADPPGPGRRVAGVDWRFNAWGNKFHGFADDDAFAGRLLAHLGMFRFAPRMVLEGGSIASDGAGTLIVTEECLLNPNRNPELTRTDIEGHLALELGARRILWLERGLVGDDTDGHVDNVACWAGRGRVLLAMPSNKRDENWEPMQENRRRLLAARDADGGSIEVIDVPLPRPGTSVDGRLLPFNYINFFIANGGLVVPAFEDALDTVAQGILADVFPDRRLVAIDARTILQGGGGIHCITYEEPAGTAWSGPGRT